MKLFVKKKTDLCFSDVCFSDVLVLLQKQSFQQRLDDVDKKWSDI